MNFDLKNENPNLKTNLCSSLASIVMVIIELRKRRLQLSVASTGNRGSNNKKEIKIRKFYTLMDLNQ